MENIFSSSRKCTFICVFHLWLCKFLPAVSHITLMNLLLRAMLTCLVWFPLAPLLSLLSFWGAGHPQTAVHLISPVLSSRESAGAAKADITLQTQRRAGACRVTGGPGAQIQIHSSHTQKNRSKNCQVLIFFFPHQSRKANIDSVLSASCNGGSVCDIL